MVYRIDTTKDCSPSTNDAIGEVSLLQSTSVTWPNREQYIEVDLTSGCDLIMEGKPKPTCSVVDLCNLLHYHWCQDDKSIGSGRARVQVAFLTQLMAYTSSQPGVIVESNAFKGEGHFLKYKVCLIALLNEPH